MVVRPKEPLASRSKSRIAAERAQHSVGLRARSIRVARVYHKEVFWTSVGIDPRTFSYFIILGDYDGGMILRI